MSITAAAAAAARRVVRIVVVAVVVVVRFQLKHGWCQSSESHVSRCSSNQSGSKQSAAAPNPKLDGELSQI
ncbi:hypothetical protein BDQ12DRAFT_689834 [Crucibulum laeve]|uniref:Uncharacterized protein n=1 Tax=Crucibulum laeve TaxID=68775 RepID=A0A5C3LN45_9AGAR|nr:hypothetical protein BDQ12DRAFT_689834 [Crucibulum laeve]